MLTRGFRVKHVCLKLLVLNKSFSVCAVQTPGRPSHTEV